jgi:hypothetical protein
MRMSNSSGPTCFGLVLTVSALLGGQTFQEDFSSDPAAHGWQGWGNTNLFYWNAAEGAVAVTWDSREPNSYFARPLGTVLGADDSFRLAFDLRLSELTPGIDPTKTNSPFQISVGLIRRADATGPGFVRGSGLQSPNLVEFSFFPDPGGAWQWGPSLTAMVCDRTGLNWSSGGFAPSGLTTSDVFHVVMDYNAATRVMGTTVLRNGEPFAAPDATSFGTNFTDFRVDAFAICSYSHIGQWPGYEGSILAHGTVDNVELMLPDPPVAAITGTEQGGHWITSFSSQTTWVYTLEATPDFAAWHNVSAATPGTGGLMTLTDTNLLADRALYRVLAERP